MITSRITKCKFKFFNFLWRELWHQNLSFETPLLHLAVCSKFTSFKLWPCFVAVCADRLQLVKKFLKHKYYLICLSNLMYVYQIFFGIKLTVLAYVLNMILWISYCLSWWCITIELSTRSWHIWTVIVAQTIDHKWTTDKQWPKKGLRTMKTRFKIKKKLIKSLVSHGYTCHNDKW